MLSRKTDARDVEYQVKNADDETIRAVCHCLMKLDEHDNPTN